MDSFYLTGLRFRLGIAAAAVLLMAGCVHKPALPELGQVPGFILLDQDNQAFNSTQKLKGHVWVADFFFTECPGPCPRMSTQLNEVQTALKGQDVRITSITVDPDNDTPEVLAAYGKRYRADPGTWYFLTGTQPQLQYLSKNVFKLGDVDGSRDHSTRFVLVDRKGSIRGYYLSSEEGAVPKLIADAKTLVEE